MSCCTPCASHEGCKRVTHSEGDAYLAEEFVDPTRVGVQAGNSHGRVRKLEVVAKELAVNAPGYHPSILLQPVRYPLPHLLNWQVLAGVSHGPSLSPSGARMNSTTALYNSRPLFPKHGRYSVRTQKRPVRAIYSKRVQGYFLAPRAFVRELPKAKAYHARRLPAVRELYHLPSRHIPARIRIYFMEC
eukprot:7029411-Pyramimonas_sp.AAC.2